MKENWITKSYYKLVKAEHFVGHVFLLGLRLFWGIALIMIGWGKFANMDQTIETFSSLNIVAPAFFAWVVAFFELVGGISLTFGIYTRIFTIPLIIIFFTAYATAHSEAVSLLFNEPLRFVNEKPFVFLTTSLIVLFTGPGIISFDYWIEKKIYQRSLAF